MRRRLRVSIPCCPSVPALCRSHVAAADERQPQTTPQPATAIHRRPPPDAHRPCGGHVRDAGQVAQDGEEHVLGQKDVGGPRHWRRRRPHRHRRGTGGGGGGRVGGGEGVTRRQPSPPLWPWGGAPPPATAPATAATQSTPSWPWGKAQKEEKKEGGGGRWGCVDAGDTARSSNHPLHPGGKRSDADHCRRQHPRQSQEQSGWEQQEGGGKKGVGRGRPVDAARHTTPPRPPPPSQGKQKNKKRATDTDNKRPALTPEGLLARGRPARKEEGRQWQKK